MLSNNLGNGKVSLLLIWQEVYTQDRPKTTSLHIQETYGGDFA